jgi:hypothetical protein
VPALMQMLFSRTRPGDKSFSLCPRQIGVSRFLQETGKAKKSSTSSKSCPKLFFLCVLCASAVNFVSCFPSAEGRLRLLSFFRKLSKKKIQSIL